MELFDVLSEEEVQSFAARLEIHPDNLWHIIEPMDGIAGINLREELERWVSHGPPQGEGTHQGYDPRAARRLVADTWATLIPP